MPNAKGKLYGIGTGPGDPELLTLKAVRVIEKCAVIAIPKTGGAEQVARSIIERFLQGKELVECFFAMEPVMEKRRAARRTAAEAVTRRLDEGKNVGFITLGDPTTYSTYMYIHKIVTGRGYEAEIIPGVTSYAAAAAALGVALCEDDEPLAILPARHGDNLDALLDFPGNKVIMKSGENLARVLTKLKERDESAEIKIACRVGMDGQRLYASADEYDKDAAAGYFTIAIVKRQPL